MAMGPSKHRIQALVESPLDTPVVMLSLLKFAERSSSGGDGAESGRDSYARCGERMRSMPEQTGARVLFQGRAHSVVIGGDGDDWVSKDRSVGLADSRLIAMTELFRGTEV